ncbi:hypothetical protein AVEN_126135-1 [Araneus ventricosus]|uniref:Uncharacterized protein n=1 Tax=Araneus ventricosus TaxID=182803 RepID=A0A4Y2NVR9_ARAVE|nr:hypothetical protein AVEN_126135-1 [Araneus ventricosus]
MCDTSHWERVADRTDVLVNSKKSTCKKRLKVEGGSSPIRPGPHRVQRTDLPYFCGEVRNTEYSNLEEAEAHFFRLMFGKGMKNFGLISVVGFECICSFLLLSSLNKSKRSKRQKECTSLKLKGRPTWPLRGV